MDIKKGVLRRASYFYSVGFFTLMFLLPLLYTVKTPLYSQISGLLKTTPLSSILAASPAILIIGIIVDQARTVLKKYIIKVNTYTVKNLPAAMIMSIEQAVSAVLKLSANEVDLKSDAQFEEAKLIILPLFDQYSIVHRWVNDFLECTILVTAFTLLVIGFRAVGAAFAGTEMVLLEVYITVLLISSVSIVGLPRKYTLAEASIFLNESDKVRK